MIYLLIHWYTYNNSKNYWNKRSAHRIKLKDEYNNFCDSGGVGDVHVCHRLCVTWKNIKKSIKLNRKHIISQGL